jgi:general secretion pathway protein D
LQIVCTTHDQYMENRNMKKLFMAVLVGSLCFAHIKLIASVTKEDDLAANYNFTPRHPAGSLATETTETPTPPPTATTSTPAPTSTPTPVSPAPATKTTSAPAPATTPAVTPVANQALQDELIRRQEMQIAGRQLIDQGYKLYYDAKYQDAINKLEQGIKILPRAQATEIDYNRAVHALTDSYYRLADAAYREGKMDDAKTLAKKAISYDSTNRSAENLIVKIIRDQNEATWKAAHPTPPEPVPPSQNPQLVAEKDEIKGLFREGRLLMNAGQYDEAETKFKQILRLDPYNDDAWTFIAELNTVRAQSLEHGTTAMRKGLLKDIDQAWIPPLGHDVEEPKQMEISKPIGTAGNTAEIVKRLNEIIFPEIRFEDANITQVVGFLSDESRKLDKTGTGVNIVLGAGVTSGASTPTAAVPAPAMPTTPGGESENAPPPEAFAPATAPAPTAGGRPITLSLRKVPMIDALKYITTLANLKYRIEPNAVVIVPVDAVEGQMVTQTYPVSPGAFGSAMSAPVDSGTEGGGSSDVTAMGGGHMATPTGATDVKKIFTDAGVVFPPGSSIFYSERTSTIIVRNTPENLETFERVLATLNIVPTQVEIEAKFIEVSQGDLDELGFNWSVAPYQTKNGVMIKGGSPNTDFETGRSLLLTSDSLGGGLRDSYDLSGNAVDQLLASSSSGTSSSSGADVTKLASVLGVGNQLATIKGIMTNPQFQVVIKAISQKKSSDILSAPKVTTVSGNQAQIRVVQEFIYPSEYSQPSAGGNVITPSIPSAFKTREIGVLLNVTPTVGADNYTINLTLIPEVSEFLGFLNYSPGTVSQTSSEVVNGVATNITQQIPYKIVQPLFSSRNVTTSIVIWDGQTVVIGGLMREDLQKIDDKVPFLGDLPVVGRLFRSKVTSRTKRNLLIFVTANLIDPAGNKIHRDKSKLRATESVS